MSPPDPLDSALSFRYARREDLPEIVRMLADDTLGEKRETYAEPLPESYYATFDAIERDSNNELVVGVVGSRVVAVLQITFLPYLTYRGSWRALIEGVRVDASVRSAGIGKRLIEWAIARARERGCRMVQLTSDKSRRDAQRFYESLGFSASHVGFKLRLDRT
jgi:ribosomal protein S18 acetylase RimI-like enzyme